MHFFVPANLIIKFPFSIPGVFCIFSFKVQSYQIIWIEKHIATREQQQEYSLLCNIIQYIYIIYNQQT